MLKKVIVISCSFVMLESFAMPKSDPQENSSSSGRPATQSLCSSDRQHNRKEHTSLVAPRTGIRQSMPASLHSMSSTLPMVPPSSEDGIGPSSMPLPSIGDDNIPGDGTSTVPLAQSDSTLYETPKSEE
ncbi:MAG: hypothetical protein K6C34_01975 [Alphaproteobacteria bacterium]|nr:hypothetical protein [Alphaproteobacteria bacterium]